MNLLEKYRHVFKIQTPEQGLNIIQLIESYLLALLRCCRAVSFSERVSDNEFAKN